MQNETFINSQVPVDRHRGVTAHEMLIEPALRQRIERTLGFATCGFEPYVRQITVHLRDANEGKGDMDTLCTVSAKFRNGDHVSVSETHPNIMAAISRALKRLRRALASRVALGTEKRHVDAPAHVTEYWFG